MPISAAYVRSAANKVRSAASSVRRSALSSTRRAALHVGGTIVYTDGGVLEFVGALDDLWFCVHALYGVGYCHGSCMY